MTTQNKHKIAIAVAAVAALGVLAYLALPGLFGRAGEQTTNDAFIAADYTLVARAWRGSSRKCWWKTTSRSRPGNCWR
ncbi:hypothetical protein PBOI14_01820 [Pseudomonas sp. Boi14]|nr:hypothetical protein PBOI14_01820 [Pseudomonas sp. Boi14]